MRLIPLSLLICLLPACQNGADPEGTTDRSKRFADFYVRYLAAEQQMRGQVSFWEGSSWDLSDPIEPGGIVSFENRKMSPKVLPGKQIRYSETFYGPYEDPLAFRFRDSDGRYLQYELKMTPVRDFFVKGKISKQGGASFVINGGVMNREESLVFLFTNAQRETTAIPFQGPNADVEVRLSPDQLAGLSIGSGELYLVKKQERAESHPKLELTATVEYYTESRPVEVEE